MSYNSTGLIFCGNRKWCITQSSISFLPGYYMHIIAWQTIRLLEDGIKVAYFGENINYIDRSYKHCHEEYSLFMLLCKCVRLQVFEM